MKMPRSVVTATESSLEGDNASNTVIDPPDYPKKVSSPKDDFFWAYTEEPHKTRRLEIIKAHPEVRLLAILKYGRSNGE